MSKIITTVNIPEWSLGALTYGDYSGLSESEELLINEFIKDNALDLDHILLAANNDDDDYGFFCDRPDFGLATVCRKYNIIDMRVT